jgi:hypothetical protein
MSSVRYLSTPDTAARIGRESAIVAKAIVRHRREAILQGRTEEAHEMEALCSGVSRMVLMLTRPHQRSNVA